MSVEDLKARTKAFALRMIDIAEALPAGCLANVIRGQLMRSGTSVGCNYRAASRARSPADFVSKMGIVEEEADECMFWMEIVAERRLLPAPDIRADMDEADEILAIVVSSIKTARGNLR